MYVCGDAHIYIRTITISGYGHENSLLSYVVQVKKRLRPVSAFTNSLVLG